MYGKLLTVSANVYALATGDSACSESCPRNGPASFLSTSRWRSVRCPTLYIHLPVYNSSLCRRPLWLCLFLSLVRALSRFLSACEIVAVSGPGPRRSMIVHARLPVYWQVWGVPR